MTNWELAGLGLFGEGAEGSNAAGWQGNAACTVGSVSRREWGRHSNQVTTTQVPLGSRAELWELRCFLTPPQHHCTNHSSDKKGVVGLETPLQPGQ